MGAGVEVGGDGGFVSGVGGGCGGEEEGEKGYDVVDLHWKSQLF